MMKATIRVNGFQTPFSRDQVVSWILQPLLMAGFISLVAKLLDSQKCLAILIPNGVLIIFILACWFYCEMKNPAETSDPNKFFSCLRVPKKMTRYCTICCKNSPGLDHHCTWLNTCIGEGNYEAFYFLIVTAMLQTILQLVIGVLMATLWISEVQDALEEEWKKPIIVILWIHNAIALSLGNSYSLLTGFHTYLLWIGSGTYDFILENGSDGLCVRMLKCKCFQKLKSMKRSDVRSNESTKTSSRKTSSADEKKSARGDHNAPSRKEEGGDIEKWKAEWLQKYGVHSNPIDLEKGATSTTSALGMTSMAAQEEKTVTLSAPMVISQNEPPLE